MTNPTDVLARIKARCIIQANGCWIWQGAATSLGYGQITVGVRKDGTRRTVYVHKAAWEAIHGPVPKGRELDHFRCDTPACANPEHVRPVTHQENILRADGPTSTNKAKTHCIHDHPFDEANTYVRRDGSRYCRACGTARARALRSRQQPA